MSMSSLIQKLTTKGPIKPSLSIVMLTDGIYLSKVNHQLSEPQATFHELKGSDWDFVLDDALKAEGFHNLNATVTLGSHLYQSYHVDKPVIPRSEWSAALPFLLKDLITDRVTDIVADGAEISQSAKIQTYVVTKQLVIQLKKVLDNHNIRLLNIQPEDEVWSHIRPDIPAYMLLHRSNKGEFKIGVFVEQGSVFQRTVRGIRSSMTGENASSLEVDALALELQRSMDYLSSQLKQVQVNTLFLCCDGESNEELTELLQQRLNVPVEPLQLKGEQQTTGIILAIATHKNEMRGINLYPKHLQPKKEVFTLDVVVVSWLVIAVAMLSTYGFYSFKNYQLEQQITSAQSEVQKLTMTVSDLDKELASRQPSAAKIAAVARLKENIETKQESLKVINSFDSKQKAGYSGVMHGLSSIGRRDISLTNIQIDNGKLNVEGLARTPEVIPNWVQNFKTQLNLIGRNFESLSIGRNENDVVVFSLRSNSGDK